MLPAAAFAAAEEGDAGDLPGAAQDLTAAPVDAIDGSVASPTDQDLYRVCVEGGGTFSATTVGGSELDTQLFLFDASGLGVYGNDDSQATRQSTLPSFHELTPIAPGEYLLGISPYDRDPESAGGAIFGGGGVLAPSGPGGSGPLSGWDGRIGLPGDYRITLTGTIGCTPPDTTPPTVDLRVPADGAQVPQGALLAVDFSCDDEGGSGLASCEGSVADGDPLDTSTLGPRPVTVSARDQAGNETVVTHTAEVVDVTPPTITLLTPLDGAVYLLDEEVLADYECADEPGGSGLASCTGDVADGEPLDTSSVGPHSFSVEATDAAGGSASATAGYAVVYDFRGFRWPVEDRPAVNRVRAGRTVPVRFSLAGFHGRHVLADGYPQIAEVECGSAEDAPEGEPARLRGRKRVYWSRWGRSYVLFWKTRRSWAGSCRQFLLGLADGTVHRADFRLKR
ncbi:MAG TPA: DVUA0089 family protein [Thermoleophilaceae bacterium]|nr:DVUA0089 family protein [Thermoleophilaceae bacterium]